VATTAPEGERALARKAIAEIAAAAAVPASA
jgi:hypothetical protein